MKLINFILNRNNLKDDIDLLISRNDMKKIGFASTTSALKSCYIISALSFLFFLLSIFFQDKIMPIIINGLIFIISIILTVLVYYKLLKGNVNYEDNSKSVYNNDEIRKKEEIYRYYKEERNKKNIQKKIR